jgi:predicted patatin/cPLA2 family phospholipase
MHWPAKSLDVIAVDAEDGSVAIFGGAKTVLLQLAIAARAAVPGFTPPITIGGRRYTDGGVAGTNLNVATGFATVVAVIPIPYAYTDDEIAKLRTHARDRDCSRRRRQIGDRSKRDGCDPEGRRR